MTQSPRRVGYPCTCACGPCPEARSDHRYLFGVSAAGGKPRFRVDAPKRIPAGGTTNDRLAHGYPLGARARVWRAVAQLGSAPDWGSGGRRFKSCQPDVKAQVRVGFSPGLHHVRGWFSVVPLWSPRHGAGRPPVDEQGAANPLPVDKGTKRGPERLRQHSRGLGTHHKLLVAGPLRRACLRCPAVERKALACSAAEARWRSSG